MFNFDNYKCKKKPTFDVVGSKGWGKVKAKQITSDFIVWRLQCESTFRAIIRSCYWNCTPPPPAPLSVRQHPQAQRCQWGHSIGSVPVHPGRCEWSRDQEWWRDRIGEGPGGCVLIVVTIRGPTHLMHWCHSLPHIRFKLNGCECLQFEMVLL